LIILVIANVSDTLSLRVLDYGQKARCYFSKFGE